MNCQIIRAIESGGILFDVFLSLFLTILMFTRLQAFLFNYCYRLCFLADNIFRFEFLIAINSSGN